MELTQDKAVGRTGDDQDEVVQPAETHMQVDDEYELEFEEVQRAKQPTSFPRAVLATSKAETSITLSDVDAVIDLGISRSIEHGDDLLLVQDFAAPAAVSTQRLGRVC